MTKEALLVESWSHGSYTLPAARDALQRAGWKVAGDGQKSIVAEHGSKAMMRIFGTSTERARNNLPVKIVVTIDGDNIRAEAYPNPGWYIFSLDLSDLYVRNARPGIEVLNGLVNE